MFEKSGGKYIYIYLARECISCRFCFFWMLTPWKINMVPKNHLIEKEKHLPNLHCWVPAVNFPWCKSLFLDSWDFPLLHSQWIPYDFDGEMVSDSSSTGASADALHLLKISVGIARDEAGSSVVLAILLVTFLGCLSDPFKWLSDLQLADKNVTLNHLAQLYQGLYSRNSTWISKNDGAVFV